MPPQYSKRQAALEEARRLLAVAKITEPPVDVERLSRLLGVREIIPIAFTSTDACLLPGRNGHTILIKRTSSGRRRRFSIAHELGHILLRARATKFRGGNRERAAQEERLCDEIAAELLMPETLFGREMMGVEPSIEAICGLAKRFDTAVEPAAIRFGLLSSAPVQVIYWERRQTCLRVKWATGKPFIPRNTTGSLSDGAFGPAVAFESHASDLITSYERSRNSASLNLTCQSGGFGEYAHRFVLSVIRGDGEGKGVV
jgi:hypothetical protein